MLQIFLDVQPQGVFDESLELVFDRRHELRLDGGILEVVLKTIDADVGLDDATRRLVLLVVDRDFEVDVIDLEEGRVGGHSLTGNFDDQVGRPLEVVQGEAVTHPVGVFGFTLVRNRAVQLLFHLFWVFQCDSVHFHVNVVLLPPHVVQFALRAGTVGVYHWSAEFGLHLADHASVGGLEHLVGYGVL